MPEKTPLTTPSSPSAIWSPRAVSKNLHGQRDRERSPIVALQTQCGPIRSVHDNAFVMADKARLRLDYDKGLAKQSMGYHEKRRGRSLAPRVLSISMRPLRRPTPTTDVWTEQRPLRWPGSPVDYQTTETIVTARHQGKGSTGIQQQRDMRMENVKDCREHAELSSSIPSLERPDMASNEHEEFSENGTQETVNTRFDLSTHGEEQFNEPGMRREQRGVPHSRSYLIRAQENKFEAEADTGSGYDVQNQSTRIPLIDHHIAYRTSESRVANRIYSQPYPSAGLEPNHLQSIKHSENSLFLIDDDTGVETAPEPSVVPGSPEDLLAIFSRYDMRWNRLSARPTKFPLNFANVPWPMLTTPRSFESITADAVAEFIFSPARIGVAPQARRLALREELKHWHPDHVARCILVAIRSTSERERIQAAAEDVYEALESFV